MANIGEETLAAAEQIIDILTQHGIPSTIIGAVALAVHNYPRATKDLDIGTDTNPFTKLRPAIASLKAAGFDAELIEPDEQDPLGGVVHVNKAGIQPIEIVNFHNPLSGAPSDLAAEAIKTSKPILQAAHALLPVVSLPHLVALKLAAGGRHDERDVVELLHRNQPLDLARIEEVCSRFGLNDRLTVLRSA